MRAITITSGSTLLRKCRTLAAACFAAGVVAFAGHADAIVYPTSNLLTNPGFETNSLTSIANVLGSPYNNGIWGYEASTITTTVGAVSPSGPTHMLSMTTDGAVATQTVQSVDVSAFSSDISANLVTASFNAKFNVEQNVVGGVAGIYLQFYDASHNFISPTNVNSLLILDSNPFTWETISVSNIPVPANTAYLLPQVLYVNASMTNTAGVNSPGYVDDAVLTLDRATTPEPSSLMALIPAGGLLLLRRRRPIA